jgi:hypothetical protein
VIPDSLVNTDVVQRAFNQLPKLCTARSSGFIGRRELIREGLSEKLEWQVAECLDCLSLLDQSLAWGEVRAEAWCSGIYLSRY